MYRHWLTILSLALLSFLGSCGSKPDMVIDEDDMIDLLADLHKSEAIIEMNPTKFKSDSVKAVVRQSIFKKHGITQEEYDSSVVWYGHNVRNYIKVYDGVIAKLDDEEFQLSNIDNPHRKMTKRVKKQYPSTGDSADIWTKEHSWILTSQYGNNMIRFDFDSKSDDKNGDCYTFIYRLRNTVGNVSVYLGADYHDGTTSFTCRNSSIEGENKIRLQSDSTKRVRRLYGYITTNPARREMVFIDSIMMLRTRLDSATYTMFATQKWAGPKRLNPNYLKKKAEEEAKKAKDATNDPEENKAESTAQRPRRYVPKPGLNKTSHSKPND